MLPSKGLRPAYIVPLVSRHTSISRSNYARQFSTAPRRIAFSAPSCRTSTLHSARWRTGASGSASMLAAPSSTAIRNGSWYAPWSWGSSSPSSKAPASTPADAAAAPSPPPPPPPASPAESAVTTQTPELSPAGIDSPAVVGSSGGGSCAPIIDPASVPAAPEEAFSWADAHTAEPQPPSEADPSQVVEQIGYLKELGLDYGWGVTSTMQWVFEHIYIYSDLSWGAAIIAGTVLIRFVTFWPLVRSADSQAKMASVSPFTKKLQEEVRIANQQGDVPRAQSLRAQLAATYKSVGTTPLTSLQGMLLQGVLGFGAFRLLRGMSSLPVPGMENMGFLWFHDLTVSDPYYTLPLAVGLFMHAVARLGGEGGSANTAMTATVRKITMYFLPVFMSLVTLWQPAALQLYFATTTVISVCVGRMLRSGAIRKKLRIAPLPTPEITSFWQKVADGQIPPEAIKRMPDGTLTVAQKYMQTSKFAIEYQSPTPTIQKNTPSGPKTYASVIANKNVDSSPRINLRPGSAMPPHLVTAEQRKKAEQALMPEQAKGLKGKAGGLWKNLVGQKASQTSSYNQRKELAKKKAQAEERKRREGVR
ncbi:60Kd inner membrane protein-domain-containing protein [Clohesyomyces aquaticus]|uniref:60Kd inner membrane protein-domain-containing protein n=1 Tax=Clohesyomyces aquaticus TaxID=1231657 RepID=A0A1Y1YGF9_9PLEO|nr:60Kd inner membrane protein-domain-containing protein [Clohesyomyces aquaticus]